MSSTMIPAATTAALVIALAGVPSDAARYVDFAECILDTEATAVAEIAAVNAVRDARIAAREAACAAGTIPALPAARVAA